MSAKIRILIVDDRAEIRQSLTNLLYFEEDMTVVGEAQNGQEALTRTDELTPDVILMDIEMPVMGGLDATRQIKAIYPLITIIVVSSESRYEKAALAAGATAFLRKPPLADHLTREIRRPFRPALP